MSAPTPLKIDLDRLLQSAPPAPAKVDEAPRLRPLPRPAQQRRSPLLSALVAVGIVLAVLAVQLGLSIAVSQGAYDLRALEIEQRDLGRVERLLQQNVDRLSSPQNLAENATQLGMVQNARPATIRLSDGVVLGSLDTAAEQAGENLVPNATLDSMPVLDAEGLLVDRESPTQGNLADPVRVEGKLPAPDTH